MITGLNHITLSVSNLDHSFDFYSRVLGFKPHAKWDSGAYLEAGNIWLALLLDNRIEETNRPDYSHIAFSCNPEDFEKLSSCLEREGFSAWQKNKSEGDSYYFLDPDGHKLEIHIGDLSSRLAAMKQTPWAEFTFYE